MNNGRPAQDADATAPEPPDALPPLWTCPRCQKQFVTPRMYHSCQVRTVDEHFAGRPRARVLFEAFRDAVESMGPATLVLNKSGIGFMTRVRFCGVFPRRDFLRAGFWLKRRIESPRLVRTQYLGRDDWIYEFIVRDPADLDAEALAWLREARAVGDQEHLARRERRKTGRLVPRS